MKRLVLGVTGATGAVYALRILEAVRRVEGWETHLVVSDAGALNIHHELGLKRREFHALADYAYAVDDIAACLASGAFATCGMIIVPCSMKTLAAVAHGFSDNLISRAADVTLKERRRLVVVPREAPLTLAHLRNMTLITEMGGIIYPPLPAFYGGPKTLETLIDETVGRLLALFEIDSGLFKPWTGLTEPSEG